jgi:carbonic anhydrase/acetyltransferase-like protein (isoleucine patch superfamily)
VPVVAYLDHQPLVEGRLALADDAFIIGKVTLAGPAKLQSSAIVRGDQSPIWIGPNFYMGRGSTAHVDPTKATLIGRDVWVGDGVVIHGCTLGDGVRVENGALVLSGSNVGAGSVVAAGALVTEGAAFPPNSYITGSPGRQVRETTADERAETIARVASLGVQ